MPQRHERRAWSHRRRSLTRNSPRRGASTPTGGSPIAAERGAAHGIPGTLPGIVIRAYGKFFDVQLRDEPRVLLSTVRGALKRTRQATALVAVGDRVAVIDVGEGEGQIAAIAPRGRVLSRRARHTTNVEQVILANPDQVLFLFAVHEPEPHRRLLDRFLILAEAAELPAIVGINKMDLDRDHQAHATFGDYESIYPVRYLSVATGAGLPELKTELTGKITAVAGPSGTGKSSLLNALHPPLARDVGEISTATGKGRQTTVATELLAIGPDTYVADTPGIRALALHGVPPEMLDHCFPEFRPFLGECFYDDCTHLHEPGCAIRAAVATGAISPARYESYAALRRGDPER